MNWNSGTDVEFHMFLFLEHLLKENKNVVTNGPSIHIDLIYNLSQVSTNIDYFLKPTVTS